MAVELPEKDILVLLHEGSQQRLLNIVTDEFVVLMGSAACLRFDEEGSGFIVNPGVHWIIKLINGNPTLLVFVSPMVIQQTRIQ